MSKQADEAVNRELWRQVNAEHTDRQADAKWAQESVTWGVYDVPEVKLGVLCDVAGRDVVELGCGTAYFSAWLARHGARPVGVDLSPEQLASARRCQETHGMRFPLVVASAERVPLADGSFDLAVSEYGASLWCEPRAWVGEAARLLRPGGLLVFLTSSVLVTLCVPESDGPAADRLTRPQRDQYRLDWPGGGVEYHPPHSEWIRVLTDAGFDVEALHELYAPADASPVEYYQIAEPGWAQRWPVEDLWVARLRR